MAVYEVIGRMAQGLYEMETNDPAVPSGGRTVAQHVVPPVEGGKKESLEGCMACSKELSDDATIALRCGDVWCKPCLETSFKLALKDETSYPPRCCWYIIPLKEVRQHLPKSLVREFQSRQLELTTKNKTYCHKTNCSVFIAPHSIHNSEAICQKCRARTCAKCKGAWHFGPCTAGELAEFMELADTNEWRRCPQCRRMVEKDEGCNHMVCRCGCEWCFGCGSKFYRCTCTFSDEEDIFFDHDMDHGVPENTVGETADQNEDRATTIENHRHQRHRDFRNVTDRGREFQCDLCAGTFYNWISICERCELHVCNRCRRTTVRR